MWRGQHGVELLGNAPHREVDRREGVVVRGVHIGAVSNQTFYDLVPAAQRGAVQRGLVEVRSRPHIRACGSQQRIDLNRLIFRVERAASGCVDPSLADSRHQRRVAVEVGQVWQRAVLEEQFDDRDIARLGSAQQWSRAHVQHGLCIPIVGHLTMRRAQFQLRIGICPAIEQPLHDLQPRRLVEGGEVDPAALGQSIHVDCTPQRRASVEIPQIYIGAGFNQIARHVPVNVQQRHYERRDAIRIGEIQVSLVAHELACALHTPFACGVQQRSESPVSHVLRASFCGDPPLPIACRRTSIRVGAMREQQAHHLRLALRRRPHQSSLTTPFFPRVDLGPVF